MHIMLCCKAHNNNNNNKQNNYFCELYYSITSLWIVSVIIISFIVIDRESSSETSQVVKFFTAFEEWTIKTCSSLDQIDWSRVMEDDSSQCYTSYDESSSSGELQLYVQQKVNSSHLP